MNKRNTLRRMLALLCCMAMLLPCVPVTLAAGELLVEDFESYASQGALEAAWEKGGNTTVNQPQLSTEKVFSGKQSLLVVDTEADKSTQTKEEMSNNHPAGTEIIMSAQYYMESTDGTAFINLWASGNHTANTYSSGQWDSLSIIYTTEAASQTLVAVVGSNAASVSKTYWDDVKVQVLTEELAVAYVNEKANAATLGSTDEMMVGLKSKALGLVGVDDANSKEYIKALKAARKEKNEPLTKEEIQACVSGVRMESLAAELEGGYLVVGEVGDISAAVVELPVGVTAQWASVSPAGKSVALADGKATATAVPTGADEEYTAVLRMSSGTKTVDVNYTILLKNTESFIQEEADKARTELSMNTVIGAASVGPVSVPELDVAGISLEWARIKSDPYNFVSLSNGQLAVTSLPTGMDYYEAIVVLKVTKGTASSELEYNIIAYDDDYRLLLPVDNGGFEVVNNAGEPIDWSIIAPATPTSYFEGADQVARTGTRSVRMVDSDPAGNLGYRSKLTTAPSKVGYEYIVSCWAKGTATSEDPNRAGFATYVEYNTEKAKNAQTEGTAIPVNETDWTLVSQWGIASTAYVGMMAYGFQSTVMDVYMDDALVWELTPRASALRTDEVIMGGGDADALYKRLSIKSMGITGLVETNKKAYLDGLTGKRAIKGSALTAEELAAEVKAINNSVVPESKALLAELSGQIKTTQTITSTGDLELPDFSAHGVTTKFTKVVGNGASRIRLTGEGARVVSLPASGKQNETAKLVLNLTNGIASMDVNVTVTMKAYTKEMTNLITAAEKLDINDYLNGQAATFVTSDLTELPTSLAGGISVTWQALDSATLEQSAALTTQGKVTRPAYGQPDAAVALRATLTKGSDKYEHDLYLIVPAAGAEETRMIITSNADFEAEAPADKFTAPEGWLKHVKWEDGANRLLTSYANVVSNMTYTGKQALRLTAGGKTITSNKGTIDIQASVMNSAVTTAREGYTYTLGAMAYADSELTGASITLRFLDNQGLTISSTTASYASAPGGSGVWKNLSVSAVAPAGTVMIHADLNGGTVAGDSYFDDVRLREWPTVANGSFELGTTGWTTEGTVVDGKLTLAAGQTAQSVVRNANRGVTYYLSLEADGGKAALRFVDKDGATLAEYDKNMKSGANAFFAYAPANTAGVQVVLTGAMTADNVKITRSVTGTGVTDGDFEISANAGVGTPWDLTDATIASNTGKTGAGLTVKADGKALSTVIPVEDGKGYIFSADVKGKGGQLQLNMYNHANKLVTQRTVTSESDGWTALTISYDQLEEAIDRTNPEHVYVQIALLGEAVFDNVSVYSTSKNVANASMENTKVAPYGTFPYSWVGYGSTANYVDNQAGQYTEGVKSLAVELFGIGEGGIRSSMLKDIKSGKAYEATVNAKGSGAKLVIEFWDKDFNKLGSEFVTIDSTDWKEYSVKGTAPNGTIYASLAVAGDGVGLVNVDEATLYPVVRSIGTNVQTFIDNWLVADSENVTRTFYAGEQMRIGEVLGAYVNIHWDATEQIYKMWHRIGNNLRYRTSEDGINWSKSTICINTETSEQCVGGYVHIDEDEPDPSKRYKGIFWNGSQSRTDGSYDYYASADGINWTFVAKGPRGCDVHTMAYDPINDEYVLTYKQPTGSPAANGEYLRTQSIAVSKDLINWTEGVRQYSVGTPADTVETNVIRTEGYGNGMYSLGDSYVSLNWRTLLDDADSFGGTLDSNMLFSRDLTEDWQRLRAEDGTAFLAIPKGEPGQPDCGQIYTDSSPINVGDETWWYYYGESGDHGYAKTPDYAGSYSAYVKWRRNGFASMDFGQSGTMTTEQFTLMGTELHLNAVGSLTVELLDANGAVVATGKFSGDSVDSVITWDKSIANQQGKVVSLRFTGSSSQLYTIQFVGSIFDDVADDAWYSSAVHYAVDNGIMGGYGGGKFGPNDTLSRAMVVQMLYNKVGQPAISGKHGFNDVPADQWFNNAVTWGTKNGVMGGYGDGKFGPNDSVTIEQIAVILWNYSGNPEFDANLGDVGSYSGWAQNGLTWARDNGILHGVNFVNATDNATRAQAAQMLTNFLRG